MAEARARYPDRKIEVWAFDEHRIGLKPVLRRVWAKVGERPTAVSTHKYEWLQLYAFVHPRTGRTEWWLANHLNTPIFQQILNAFAKTLEVGDKADDKADDGADDERKKIAILVLDNAGWHVSNELVVPDNIQFCFLPPYTPEQQPAERLWPLTDEPVANRSFESLNELEDVVSTRCIALDDEKELIRDTTCFHWWPNE